MRPNFKAFMVVPKRGKGEQLRKMLGGMYAAARNAQPPAVRRGRARRDWRGRWTPPRARAVAWGMRACVLRHEASVGAELPTEL